MKNPPPVNEYLALLEKRAPRPLTIEEMARLLDQTRFDRKAIRAALELEVTGGRLRRIGKTRYQWLREKDRPGPTPQRLKASQVRQNRIEGLYSRVRAGYGFVEVLGRHADSFQRDILIPEAMEADALHGDRVEVEVTRQDRRSGRVVGRVVAVTRRLHETIIGTLERAAGRWQLVPANEMLPRVELLGGKQPAHEEEGLIATVRLTRPPAPGKLPGGELVQVMGEADDPEVQFLTIAFEHGLRIEFPPQVLAEASRPPDDPPEKEFAGREDLRARAFVTIDGETARDFDDAVCLEPLPGGGSRLWVAIADVSHYVRPGTALDEEALLRGTSVYFPDRAIPMLPEQLSNGLCSLNPGRPRLVQMAEMEYDADGRRQRSRFYRGVISSHARLTYTKVAALLSQAETPEILDLKKEHASLLPMLGAMHALMRRFYRNRVREGSLDLDLPEALIDLSEEGRTVGLRLSMRNDAHRMIEEFMLEANRAVAIYLEENKIPFPYRIHEPPDPTDVDDLNESLEVFGFGVDYEGRVRPGDVQRLLGQLQNHRLSRVLSRLVLRSLKQAQYTTKNAGHFGLAFATYCHFTSPIRRYPDLLVHRQLGRLFDGKAEEARALSGALDAQSVQNSQSEREAMGAERAMLDLRKAEFMLGHLLEEEEGTIVAVTGFGLFVELDAYPVEGLVRFDDLGDDRYVLDETGHAAVGKRSGERLGLGDRVLVQATNVSLRRRQVDFALLGRLTPAVPAGAHRGPKRRKKVQGKRQGRLPEKGKKARRASIKGQNASRKNKPRKKR